MTAPSGIAAVFAVDGLSPEDVAEQAALYGPLAAAVRDLVDASMRTEVEAGEVREVTAAVEALTARLRRRQHDGPLGVRVGADGGSRAWGNAVIGLRNPLAPPVPIETDPAGNGDLSCRFTLGAAYEGPPGHVHGGVLSLVLDQMLGQSAGAGGRPGMTANLTLTYRRPTPLGELTGRAWIERTEGHKTWARGELATADGVTVEAEGLFILPRWARGTDVDPAAATEAG